MQDLKAAGTIERTTILLAEDESDDVLLIEGAFREAAVPYQLKVVSNGEEALQYLKGEGPYVDRTQHPKPFLLLLDLKMPIKSGFDVLRWIRRQSALNTLLVIILSSSALSSDACEAEQLGTNSYLVKTADYKQLILFLKSLDPK